MATIPGSNKTPQNMGGNYNPMHILKWLMCHTAICDDATTTNEDIRNAFVEQNPNYEQYRLTHTIGKYLNMIYWDKLQKRRINNRVGYNVQVFDDALMDIIIKRGGQ